LRALGLGIVVAIVVVATPARADNVDALVKLIENQPADMDRPTWREKRRDAAKKLAASKDKRATPELVKLAESETFDIIGEIAIEGLGTLGDPAAVPTLQKIAADPQRDKSQRELAKKALAKLGANADTKVETKTETKVETKTETKTETEGAGSGSSVERVEGVGVKSKSELPAGPTLPDDTLAAYERVTFIGGTASLMYDTVQSRTDFAADVTGTYNRRIDRPGFAWGADATAHVVSGGTSEGGLHTRGAELQLQGDGEARFYKGSFYGIGKAALALEMDYVSYNDSNNPQNNFAESTLYTDVELAIGGGYGRVLDVGAAIRVRRIARTLDAARALGKPIDAATAKKLQLAWWALRAERSPYRALIATVAILREAGILLAEPDAGLSYELLAILRDTWLYVRPSGLDIQLVVSEGLMRRPAGAMGGTVEGSGQYAQVIATAGYGRQLDDDKLELSGNAYARAIVAAPMNQASPYGLGATASMRRFTYGEHNDPFGLLDLTADVAFTNDDLMTSSKSLRITGTIGFTYLLNQASGIRLAGQIIEDNGRLFLGASLQATYGLLDGSFAR
jgi:hypothetical protein